MKKHKEMIDKTEAFLSIIQTIIKIHHKMPEMTFLGIINNVIFTTEVQTNEELLDNLKKFYAQELN